MSAVDGTFIMSIYFVPAKAVLSRVNRQLARNSVKLKKSRGERAIANLGEYWQLDCLFNLVMATHIDLEEFARKIGALKPHEAMTN